MAFSIGVGPTDTTDNDGSSSAQVTLNGTTAGRSLLVCVRWFNGSETISSIACSGESNLTLQTRSGPDGGGRNVQWASLNNISTGGDKTITVTFSGSTFHVGLMAVEVVGGDTTDIFDAVGNASGSSADPTVNVTTAQLGAAIFAGCFTSNANELNPGSGYTSIAFGQTTGSAHGEYDLDAGAAGSKTANFTDSSGTGNWVISAIALNPQGNSAVFNLPVLDLTAQGHTLGAVFNFPVLDLTAAGSGGVGTLTKALPKLALNAGGSSGIGSAQFSLPSLGLFGSDELGNARFILPVTALSAAGVTGHTGSFATRLPKIQLAISALQNGLGAASPALPALRLAAAGATGHVGRATFELPVLDLAGFGLHNVTGTAAFALPILRLSAGGQQVLAEVYRTWVLNTRKAALTEYDFQFNSYALFQGQVIAAGSTGIVVLGTQDKDNISDILARVRVGKSHYGLSRMKRVPRIYVGLEAAGDMLFRTITSEHGSRTYRLPYNRVVGITQRRVPVGKGPKAVHWQYELENENGADFSLQNMLVHPTMLRRRVQ